MQMQNSMYKQDQFRSHVMYNYRMKRLQQLLQREVPDLKDEFDVDLADLQDHKFIQGEQFEIYQKKQDRFNTYQVENVLDEMIYAKPSLVGMNEGNQSYNMWISCDTDKLLPNGAIRNSYRVSLSCFYNSIAKTH